MTYFNFAMSLGTQMSSQTKNHKNTTKKELNHVVFSLQHSFNHADRQHHELSQPFIQSCMAKCCRETPADAAASCACLIIFHRANSQHHLLTDHHHVGQLSALRKPTAILPPPPIHIRPHASPACFSGRPQPPFDGR